MTSRHNQHARRLLRRAGYKVGGSGEPAIPDFLIELPQSPQPGRSPRVPTSAGPPRIAGYVPEGNWDLVFGPGAKMPDGAKMPEGGAAKAGAADIEE